MKNTLGHGVTSTLQSPPPPPAFQINAPRSSPTTLTTVSNTVTSSQPSEPRSSQLIIMNAWMNEFTPCKLLLDTGASSCFVSRQFCIDNGIEILTASTGYNVTVANNQSESRNEFVMIELTVSNIKFRLSLIVMPELPVSDIILGINWYKVFNPIVNYSTNSVTFDSSQIQSSSQSSDIIVQSFNLSVDTATIKVPGMKMHTSVTDPVCSFTILKDDTIQRSEYRQCQVQSTQQSPSTATSKRIKFIQHRRLVKKLLNDPDNKILCSIIMCPTNKSDEPTPSPLSSQFYTHNVVTQSNKDDDIKYNQYELNIHKQYSTLFEPISGLPPPRLHDHKIELVPGSTPPAQQAYRMSSSELDELKRQLDDLLEHGFIRPSRSPYGAPILFVKKKDGSTRMCVDYRQLNNITIKNKYPLPRVDELLNRLSGKKYFSKLDLQSGYHQIRMAVGDEHKTAFRTRYGSFEFLVLPFGLTNAPSTFMAMMQDILKPYLDEFCISFLDDICIYSDSLEEHHQHVHKIMKLLADNKLFVKKSKCEMFRQSIEFLGYKISHDGLHMMEDKLRTIEQWPVPTTCKQVRQFTGLCGFYRQFIPMFSHIVAPLSELKSKTVVFHWTDRHQKSFEQLKLAMLTKPTLAIPRDTLDFIVHTDASGYAVGAALLQDHGKGLQPVAHMSLKMKPAEVRYPVHEQELLAIVEALKAWRHFLYGKHFKIYTDHQSLVHLKTQPQLSNRQHRWIEFLSQFDFEIIYKPGSTNIVADALSRRADHESPPVEAIQVNTATTTTTVNQDSISIIDKLKNSYQSDEQCQSILLQHQQGNTMSEWKVIDGLIYNRQKQLLVPNNESLRTYIIHSCHDELTASHRSMVKTVELIQRQFYWKHMHETISNYVSTCHICQQVKISTQVKLGLLHPIKSPDSPWHTFTMDLIKLPRTISGYDCVIVYVDKLTKMVHYVPCNIEIDSIGLAKLTIHNVIRLHGIPIKIISDRDPRITSSFWSELWKQLGTTIRMSTAFHPQTDGQTERANRTLIEQLRCYVNYHQDDWDQYLSVLEMAHNNAISSTTGYSPFFLNYGFHPVTPLVFDLSRNQVSEEVKSMHNGAATEHIENMYNAWTTALQSTEKAQAAQKKQADKHRRDFDELNVGDLVLLSTKNLTNIGRASKLVEERVGPFKISKVINKLNYELELPSSMSRIHNRFHISTLTKYKLNDSFPSRPPVATRPSAVMIDEEEHYEVDEILRHRNTGTKLQFLVHWKNYPISESTWESFDKLVKHAMESIHYYEKYVLKSKLKLPTVQIKSTRSTTNSSSNNNVKVTTNSSSLQQSLLNSNYDSDETEDEAEMKYDNENEMKYNNDEPINATAKKYNSIITPTSSLPTSSTKTPSTTIPIKQSPVNNTPKQPVCVNNKCSNSSLRACDQCSANNNKQKRCKRNTCLYGPTCWQHTPTLVVKTSTIKGAGKGLFTGPQTSFRRGDKIIEYTGEILNAQQFEQRYPDEHHPSHYTVEVKNNYFIDARKTNSGIGRYANTCTGRNNTIFSAVHRNGISRVWIKANRAIGPNTELFVPYGKQFKVQQQT